MFRLKQLSVRHVQHVRQMLIVSLLFVCSDDTVVLLCFG